MKRVYLLLMAVIYVICGFGQAPEKMSYQAVIRNNSNQLVASQNIGIKISIIQSSVEGTVVYAETHSPNTNNNGLVSLEIGTGTVESGEFSTIDWASGPYFIKTETDPSADGGTSYSLTSTSELLSVPFALYAKKAGNTFSGNYDDLTNAPDFAGWDIDSTNDVTLNDTQTIPGNKTFTGTITVPTPLDSADAANKAYVDALESKISELEDLIFEAGMYKEKDADGNEYRVIKIGSQYWFNENLKTTKYNNGKPISKVTGGGTWGNTTTPAYCWYDNDSATYAGTYGALYNWYMINTDSLCPSGWHVPTNDEWAVLINFLGGESVAGGKLKETGLDHWWSPNTGATDEWNFTALPAGYRAMNGVFMPPGQYGYWWTATQYNSTDAWYRATAYNNSTVINIHPSKKNGFSVRCIKD
ncbi:MAG: fibrobacter succinogenes major paralogous domain-containing protein [Bacteroidales bacterium]|nr:fibrobacter succinogenes major paralogous domain-containing protein [Bacteroidales bacterium]